MTAYPRLAECLVVTIQARTAKLLCHHVACDCILRNTIRDLVVHVKLEPPIDRNARSPQQRAPLNYCASRMQDVH